jgi:hypothetical protein
MCKIGKRIKYEEIKKDYVLWDGSHSFFYLVTTIINGVVHIETYECRKGGIHLFQDSEDMTKEEYEEYFKDDILYDIIEEERVFPWNI